MNNIEVVMKQRQCILLHYYDRYFRNPNQKNKNKLLQYYSQIVDPLVNIFQTDQKSFLKKQLVLKKRLILKNRLMKYINISFFEENIQEEIKKKYNYELKKLNQIERMINYEK